MRFEADEVTLLGGVRHGRTLGSPVAIEIGNTEWPKWTAGDVARTGRDREAADATTAGSRRSRRHAEVRVPRRSRRSRAGQRPRDSGAGRRRVLRQGFAGDNRGRSVLSHVVAMGSASVGDRPGTPSPGGPRRRRRVARALLRRCSRGGDDRRGQGGGQGGRLARRCRRGAGLRRARRPRQPRALGPQARQPPRRRAHEHPGGEGCRDR